MAPEVMCRQNHTTAVDYFAVGVMAYECMFGRVSINLAGSDSLLLTMIFLFVATIHRQVKEGDP